MKLIGAIGENWPPLMALSICWVAPLVFVIWRLFQLQENESAMNRAALDRNTEAIGRLLIAIEGWRK